MDRYRNTCSLDDFCRIIGLLFWNSGLRMIILGIAIFVLLMFEKTYCELFAGAIVFYGLIYLSAYWMMAYKNSANIGSLTENLLETKKDLDKLGLVRFLRKLYCGNGRGREQRTHPTMILVTPSRVTVDSPNVQKRRSHSPASRIFGLQSRQAGSASDDYELAECVLGVSRTPPPRPSTSKPTPQKSLPSERERAQGESISPRALQRTRSWEQESCKLVSPSEAPDPLTRASRRLNFKSQSTEETASSSAVYMNIPTALRRQNIESASRTPSPESGFERRTTRSSTKSGFKQR